MKRVMSILFLFVFISGTAAAQSDFELVKRFKESVSAIERKINAAKTSTEVTKISMNINKLKREYINHKSLLDEALYPDNFESTFGNLNKKLSLALKNSGEKENLRLEVGKLKTRVTALKVQIDKLTEENIKLVREVKILNAGRKAGHNVVDSLKLVVAKLKANLSDRDKIISLFIDSLFFNLSDTPQNFNQVEKRDIAKRIKDANLLANIKKNISDNVTLLENGIFDGEDLIQLRENYLNFKEKWEIFGQNLAAIYAGRKSSENEVKEIDSMIDRWDKAFDSQVWTAINSHFEQAGIPIEGINGADTFYAKVNEFLDKMIAGNGVSDEEQHRLFGKFTVDVWDNQITEYWIPMLEDRGIFSDDEVKTIESKIESWGQKLPEGFSNMYFYGIILVILLISIIIIFTLAFKKKK